MDEREIVRTQKRVLLFVSHKSRSGQASLAKVQALLAERGHVVVNDSNDSQTNPNNVILQHPSVDAVIVGGGDGSVNFVLPTMVKFPELPLLVLPLGTANNLARSLELPPSIESVLDLLDVGAIRKIDLGTANDIPFVNVVGLGLSTEINRRTPSLLKRFTGVFAFLLTGLRIVHRMNPFRATIATTDGKVVYSKSWQISVVNGKHYGAGMVIKHDATHSDGQLHLLSLEVEHWWQSFKLIPSILAGRYQREQAITILASRGFRIETRRKLKVDIDGDIKTETPVNFTLLPEAMSVIVPV